MKHRLFLILLAAVMLLPGCSRKASNPPVTRSNLILEILYALDRKDYATALSRTKRLRSLDPSNSVLSELEQVLKCNIPIRDAAKLFTEGKRKEAFEVLDKAIREHGNVKQLINARAEFTTLASLDRCLAGVADPVSSVGLQECVREILLLTNKKPEFAAIRKYAEEHLRKDMPRVIKREQDLILFFVSADLDKYSRTDPARRPAYSVMKENFANFIRESAVQQNILNSTTRERY